MPGPGGRGQGRNYVYTRLLFVITGAFLVAQNASRLDAQTLSLSSATASAGGPASLSLTLSGASTSISALQWTVQYPASVGAVSVAAGSALTSAGKSLSCNPGAGSYVCIAEGSNANPIANGVVATVSLTAAQTSTLAVASTAAVAPDGTFMPLSGAGGTVTVASAAPTLSALSCTPTSLSGASSSSCTVTMSGAVTAATAVSLSSNNSAVVVPGSVTVLAGASTAQFAAVASSSLNATVTITATLSGVSKTATLALTTSTFSLRVHPGGAAYTDAQGFTWSADTGYSGGTPWSTTNTVAKTNAVPLYQTVRYGNFGYQFSVPNGTYTVNLKFAEVSRTSVGQRVFSVTLNGQVVLPNFDIVAAAGGPLVAIDKQFTVTVTNGSVQLGFIQQADYPMVNAIEIVQQGAPLSQTALPTPTSFTTLYINSGGPAYTDPQGHVWTADQDSTGGLAWSTTQSVSNTTTPTVYQSCRYGQFAYLVALPNGNYNVTLKFAEIARTGAGQRVFNVDINGTPVLTNFDIVASVGAPMVALDKTFPVTVSNGILVIGFIPGPSDLPMINAIEVAAN